MKLFGFRKKDQTIQRSKKRGFYESVDTKLIQDIQSLLISNADMNDVISNNWSKLTSRARQAYNNSDYPRHFVSLACVNVVGHNGIRIQCQSSNKKLNSKVERSYKLWAENCDVTNRLSFIDIQIQCLKSMIRDGEFFLIMHLDESHQLKLQLIDPSRLDPQLNIDLGNGRKILNGVEVDSLGKPLAYHFTKDQSGETERYQAEHVIHGYLSDYVGQLRGISWFTTAMIRLHLLKEFETAAVDNAKTGAKFFGIFKKGDEVPIEGEEPEIHQFEGSGMFELPPGVDFSGFDPAFPSGDYAPFKTSILQAISGSLGYGVSYVSLANDLKGVSYSSVRQGALAERDAWRMIQQHLITCLVRPVYRSWLEIEKLSGRLNCSPLRYKELMYARYQPRSWAWVDPLKDSKGVSEDLNNLTKSLSEVILERGGDPDETFNQIAHDNKKLKELGIERSDQNSNSAKLKSNEQLEEDALNGED